ncbi:hypothetical protein D3C85_1871280 [compost metagenome]
MVSRVNGGQSRTAILAAANAELHRKQKAAGTVGMAFMRDPKGGTAAAFAAE